jgi:hypothetical protein
MWSAFLSSDERNALLGVGLRFREIFYVGRQYLRDMISVTYDQWGDPPSRCFLFLYVSAEMQILA